ncbi:MAG TPA: hypothetical protein VLH35_05130 [Candidatus Acidoferrales bacterium]|nr:hypothetical protein [Candidatus Acidoferrales bacterium]
MAGTETEPLVMVVMISMLPEKRLAAYNPTISNTNATSKLDALRIFGRNIVNV